MSGNGGQLFSREEMFEIFSKVGELCKELNVYAEIAVYGGSSLMMQSSLFDVERLTEDVDYVGLSASNEDVLEQIFDEVTQELGFEDKVFRGDVSMLISDMAEYNYFAQYPKDSGHFRVFNCKPEYLLAMKARAMRSGLTSRDPMDFYNLATELDIKSLEEVTAIVEKYYPGEPLERPNELNIIDLLAYKASLNNPKTDKDDAKIRFIAR